MAHGCIRSFSALGQTQVLGRKKRLNWSEALLVVSKTLAANATKWTRLVMLHALVHCWLGWCYKPGVTRLLLLLWVCRYCPGLNSVPISAKIRSVCQLLRAAGCCAICQSTAGQHRLWHTMQANVTPQQLIHVLISDESSATVGVDCNHNRNFHPVGEMANQFKVCPDSTQRVHVWVTASLKLYAPKVWCIKFQVCGSPHVRVVIVWGCRSVDQ